MLDQLTSAFGPAAAIVIAALVWAYLRERARVTAISVELALAKLEHTKDLHRWIAALSAASSAEPVKNSTDSPDS